MRTCEDDLCVESARCMAQNDCDGARVCHPEVGACVDQCAVLPCPEGQSCGADELCQEAPGCTGDSECLGARRCLLEKLSLR